MASFAFRSLFVASLFGLLDAQGYPQPESPNEFTATWAGKYTSFFTDHRGFWGCGRNDHNQLGTGRNPTCYSHPIFPGEIAWVAVGSAHTLFLADDGLLWGAGRNNHGQLGDVIAPERGTVQLELPLGEGFRVQTVAAGHAHSLALASKPGGFIKVFATGWNAQGQLGTGDTEDRAAWTLIYERNGTRERQCEVTAGHDFSFILTFAGSEDTVGGEVLAFGNNLGGQLGIGSRVSQLQPVLVPQHGERIRQVSAGLSHSIFTVEKDNETWGIWGAGSNFAGQLGDGSTINRDTLVRSGFEEAPEVMWRTAVSAGGDGSAARTGQTLMATGSNHFGQLGLGEQASALQFTLVVEVRDELRSIAVGPHHSILQGFESQEFKFLATGMNNYGQLMDCERDPRITFDDSVTSTGTSTGSTTVTTATTTAAEAEATTTTRPRDISSATDLTWWIAGAIGVAAALGGVASYVRRPAEITSTAAPEEPAGSTEMVSSP